MADDEITALAAEHGFDLTTLDDAEAREWVLERLEIGVRQFTNGGDCPHAAMQKTIALLKKFLTAESIEARVQEWLDAAGELA